MSEFTTESLNQHPENIGNLLRKSRLFSQISEDEINLVVPHLSAHRYPAKHVLSEEGVKNERVYFLVKGRVSVYVDGEFIMHLRRLGDMCGEFQVLAGQTGMASEIATTDIDVLRLDMRQVIDNEKADSEEIENLLFRLFSVMLIDKFALTASRAGLATKAESELAASKQQLYEAFSDVTRVFQVKEYFLNNINHDYRSPTHAIMGTTNMLLESGLNEQQKKYAQMIRISAESLMKIVNSLLVYANHEMGRVTINEMTFELTDVIKSARSGGKQRQTNHDVTLEINVDQHVPNWLIGDFHRVCLILSSLLDNAYKFTATGKIVIAVDLESGTDEQKVVRFSVADSGVGIPEEFRACVFDAFTQADASLTRKWSGIGLGLAMCKTLVELLKGRIGFESEQHVGSTFWFTLPFKTIKAQSKSDGLPSVNENGENPLLIESVYEKERKTILVVDHDPIERLVISQMIRNLGHYSQAVDSGLKALSLLEITHFDQVIINLYLPDIDGYEVAMRLQQSSEWETGSETPTVALSSFILDSDFFQYQTVGFTDMLEKPLSYEKLRATIGEWGPPLVEDDMDSEWVTDHGGDSITQTVKVALKELRENTGAEEPVVSCFLSEYSEKMDALENALEIEDIESVIRISSQLRINCSIFGQVPVVPLIGKIENMARMGKIGPIRATLDEAKPELENLARILVLGLKPA